MTTTLQLSNYCSSLTTALNTPTLFTASNTPFGIGDDTDSAFQLVSDTGEPMVSLVGVPIIYRADWQGSLTLSTTQRWNRLTHSNDFNSWTSETVAGTQTIVAPDGNTTAWEFTGVGASNIAGAALGGTPFTILPNQAYVFSVWLKVPSSTSDVVVSLTSGLISSSVIASLTTSWQRFSISIITGAAPISMIWRIAYNDSQIIHVFSGQLEEGSIPTSYISTTTASASVTDYSINTAEVVLLNQIPVSGALLSWSGQGYYLSSEILPLYPESPLYIYRKFPTTCDWDLTVDNLGNIAVVSDAHQIAQDVASVVRTATGDLYFDTTQGVPYQTQVWGQNFVPSLAKAYVEQAALSVPGVVRAKATLAVTNRIMTGNVSVIDETGKSLNVQF